MEDKKTLVGDAHVANPTTDGVVNTSVSFFAKFDALQKEQQIVAKDRDTVVAQLIARGCRVVRDLTVRMVSVSIDEKNPDSKGVCFSLKNIADNQFKVIGDVYESVDELGRPVKGIGFTMNVQSSLYAVTGVMKDIPELAVFVPKVENDPTMLNTLFSGGKVDIIMEPVEANMIYTNPFSKNARPTSFPRDKVLHHVLNLQLGEMGKIKLANLLK